MCGGDRSTIAKALMDFQTVSCTALNRSASLRATNTPSDEGVTDVEANVLKETAM